jgi:hypothetical protein
MKNHKRNVNLFRFKTNKKDVKFFLSFFLSNIAEPLSYRPHSTTPSNQMPMMNPYMHAATAGAFVNPYVNNDYWNYMNYQYMQFVK